jgi:hypothetical protein
VHVRDGGGEPVEHGRQAHRRCSGSVRPRGPSGERNLLACCPTGVRRHLGGEEPKRL